MNFVSRFGTIDFILFLTCEERTVKERWMKKNEADDVPEEQVEDFKTQSSLNDSRKNKFIDLVHKAGDKTNIMNIDTSKVASLESLSRELNNNFSAKVVLVNHEKAIPIDNVCANIAIKWNMLYISAYQVIKKHILGKTDWGLKLEANRKNKALVQALHARDEHQEFMFSPVHFDLTLVMQLLK
jgi:hypothetical protein